MEKKKNIWVGKIVVIVLIIVSIGSYYVFPSVKHVMNQVFKMFASGDFAVVRDFVASYGAYAALISFLLMIFQSIAAPLPAFLITFANANLFGWWQGAILSWSSAMAGAAVCFFISRILGRDVAEKLTSKAGMQQIDTFFKKYGKNTVLICRLLPFVSFDIVSYAAGLTSMSFISFFCGNWCRTASGNDCIFLCWRNADRRSEASGDRTADPVCSVGTDFYGEKDLHGQTE